MNATLLLLVVLLLALGCAHAPTPRNGDVVVPEPTVEAAINATCPRSGKPIAADALTVYRGEVVGFCNPHCRDDFAAHVSERPADRALFDALIDGE